MTSTPANVTVGQDVLVKIAGRIIPVRVEAVLPDGWMVRSATSGKIFKTKKLHEQPANEAAAPESEPASEPAPEAPRTRKVSLLDAAIEVLKAESRAMNTREMVKLAIERGIWIKTACKTPEQSLYGAIFREIKESEHARIRKSEKRGLFEYAG